MPTTKKADTHGLPKARAGHAARQAAGVTKRKPVQSRVRRKIEELAIGKNMRVEALGYGEVFLVPSKSDPGAYYVVAQVGLKQFVCSCKGFRYNPEDSCTHVKQVLEHRDKVNSKPKKTTRKG